MECLKDFDLIKILIFLAPGASFAIFRSFAIRGFFPRLSKDDLGALAIGSCVYILLLRVFGTDAMAAMKSDLRPVWWWTFILFVVPICFGLLSGFTEANDVVGKLLRRFGFRLPSPEPSAWETMFREMPLDSVLLVRLADEVWVCGRWVHGSASSQFSDDHDLFLAEIGGVDDGVYQPYIPKRGAYFSAGEIKRIEIIRVFEVNNGARP